MDEIEGLLPSLVSIHEWIAGRDTLLWAPPVGNIPECTPLDNSLNRYILNSLHFHCVFSGFVARRGREQTREERNICASVSLQQSKSPED